MKALVTGGAGFIGFNLCKRLVEDGWCVTVIDNMSSGHEGNVLPEVAYNREDITYRSVVSQILATGFDTVFHLAAIPRVSYSVEHPYLTAQTNVMGTLNILEEARVAEKRPRIIYSSSSSVYGSVDVLPTPEYHSKHPLSPYALEKWQAEEWCRMYAELYDMDIVSLRYFNAFGPYSRYGGAYSTVISAWLYSLYVDPKSRPYLEGDGGQTRDFCFVDNAVAANIAAATLHSQWHGEAYNIAQGSAHSLIEVRDILEKISGQTLDIEWRPPRVGDVKDTLADISNAEIDLGYNPDTDFEAQIEKMAKWYREDYS